MSDSIEGLVDVVGAASLPFRCAICMARTSWKWWLDTPLCGTHGDGWESSAECARLMQVKIENPFWRLYREGVDPSSVWPTEGDWCNAFSKWLKTAKDGQNSNERMPGSGPVANKTKPAP